MKAALSRGVSWLAAAVIGGVYGVAATIAHAYTWGVIPVGLILGAIACAALLVALRALTGDRWAALAAGVGSPVSLWGEDGPSVDEVAQAAGTIGYELLCAVAPRVPVIREP